MDLILNQARDRMRKAFQVTQQDVSTIRSGRATPALIEHVSVSVYGASQRLTIMELATITTSDSRTLVVAPFDPSITNEIEKGILEANIGLTPVVDGEIIRITIPPLSEERRREYIRLMKAKLEGGRIMIRQVRQEAMQSLKRAQGEKEISEDQRKHTEKTIQELTDEFIAEIDALGERKEQELLQV